MRLGLLLLLWSSTAVMAHDMAAFSDKKRDDWYRSLMRPDTKTSCCHLTDCKMTVAVQVDGIWWAEVKGGSPDVSGDGELQIPADKVLDHPLSIDGEAYVCMSPTTQFVFCFVPPIPGY